MNQLIYPEDSENKENKPLNSLSDPTSVDPTPELGPTRKKPT